MFFKAIHTRIKIVFIIIIILLIIIIGKVFYIQVIDYKKLNKLSSSLWSRNLLGKGLFLYKLIEGKYMIEMVLFLRIIKQRLH